MALCCEVHSCTREFHIALYAQVCLPRLARLCWTHLGRGKGVVPASVHTPAALQDNPSAPAPHRQTLFSHQTADCLQRPLIINRVLMSVFSPLMRRKILFFLVFFKCHVNHNLCCHACFPIYDQEFLLNQCCHHERTHKNSK